MGWFSNRQSRNPSDSHGLTSGQGYRASLLALPFTASVLLHGAALLVLLGTVGTEITTPADISASAHHRVFRIELLQPNQAQDKLKQIANEPVLTSQQPDLGNFPDFLSTTTSPPYEGPSLAQADGQESAHRSPQAPEASAEPIPGLAMGRMGFGPFGGGGRRSLFSQPITTGATGVGDHRSATLARVEAMHAMLKSFEGDLNRKFPDTVTQHCRLQPLPACDQPDPNLHNYLTLQLPLLQQLMGSTPLSAEVERGQWRIRPMREF